MKRDESFPKSQRLTNSSEIRKLILTGQRFVGSLVILYAQPHPEPRPVRAAFVVKKGIGSAVSRNRMKRWMRESFRRCKDLYAGTGDLVFVAKSITGDIERGYERCFKDMSRMGEKIKAVGSGV